jgi:hypothetical protein
MTASVGERREAQASSSTAKTEIFQLIAPSSYWLRRALAAVTLVSMAAKFVLCI